MTKCAHCGGNLLEEQVERVYQRAASRTELRCLMCGRPDEAPAITAADVACSQAGCTRLARTPGGLCLAHSRAASRVAAGVRT